MVTVNEAHCISQWGQDFRPSYLKILDFIDSLPRRPIVSAFTATATREVKDDIVCTLRLHDPKVLVTGFDRPNLYFQVERIRRKDDFVIQYLRDHPRRERHHLLRHPQECGQAAGASDRIRLFGHKVPRGPVRRSTPQKSE